MECTISQVIETFKNFENQLTLQNAEIFYNLLKSFDSDGKQLLEECGAVLDFSIFCNLHGDIFAKTVAPDDYPKWLEYVEIVVFGQPVFDLNKYEAPADIETLNYEKSTLNKNTPKYLEYRCKLHFNTVRKILSNINPAVKA